MSFVPTGYNKVGDTLNEEGIAACTGLHCTQPIFRRFEVKLTVRPSRAFYNTFNEVDKLVTVVRRLSTGRNTHPS